MRCTATGRKIESETERWLLARIAPPSAGMFSSPLTHGRKNTFTSGPTMNLFMNW